MIVRLVIAGVAIAITLALYYGLNLDFLLSYLAGINVTTFGAYGADKMQARRGGWRISEATLLVLGAVGGIVGALIAQSYFRHKTSKPSFRLAFWLIAAGQAVALGLYLYYGWRS
ncbi:MAG: DUF1294 domain-containing protein [Phycisphaerae bacterium]